MKFLLGFFLISSSFLFLDNEESVVNWSIDTTYDFGLLEQGTPSTVNFPFKNISKEPIVIDNVRVGCGCTAPTWEKTPIMPDSIGYLAIEYDANKLGYFYKKVRVFFSGQRRPEILWIEGEVE